MDSTGGPGMDTLVRPATSRVISVLPLPRNANSSAARPVTTCVVTLNSRRNAAEWRPTEGKAILLNEISFPPDPVLFANIWRRQETVAVMGASLLLVLSVGALTACSGANTYPAEDFSTAASA